MEKCNGTNGDKKGTRKENRNRSKCPGQWEDGPDPMLQVQVQVVSGPDLDQTFIFTI